MYNHLNVVSDHPHIPKGAFLFVPYKSQELASRDDYRIGEGKNIRRLLFQGWASDSYTPYELEKLKQFDQFLISKKVTLDSRWDRTWRLRFLLSVGCDNQKCLSDMGTFLTFIEKVQRMHLTSSILRVLNQGAFYVGGRDCHFRPILVFNVEKVLELKLTEDEAMEAQTYFFEYVMRELLIPGQVENWVCLIDSGYQGVMSLVGALKKSFQFLAQTYRSRLFACYNVRVPTSIWMIWSVCKKFLQPDTIEKINLFDGNLAEPLFQYCNPSQVEEKFGGNHPDIQAGYFWPPRELSPTYNCTKQRTGSMTSQEYTEHIKKGRLHSTKIHQDLVIKQPRPIEYRENNNLSLIKKLDREFKLLMESNTEQMMEFDYSIEAESPLNFKSLMSKQLLD